MDIANYLELPDSLAIARIAERLSGMPDSSVVRQWRTGARRPSAARCVELTQIDGRMTLQALRPSDWFLIWPRLPGASKAKAAAMRFMARIAPSAKTAATATTNTA